MEYGKKIGMAAMPYKILLCFGTRPEWIKIKPVITAMKRSSLFEPTILFTGQHDSLVEESHWDIKLDIPDLVNVENRLNRVIASQVAELGMKWKNYDAVLVQGDTASVFAMALNAFNHKIPLIHLEAGMRTWDMLDPYPEEGYRQMVSRIASLHLCPTEQEKNNLLQEEIDVSMIQVVGNTVLDNISHLYPTRGNKVLITMHRRENEEYFMDYFRNLVALAEKHPELEFVFPMHPTDAVQRHRHIFENTKVSVVDPMPHNEFIIKLNNCGAIITDSGGVQEEAVFLNKPTIVCRRQLERNACEGIMTYVAFDPDILEEVFEMALEGAPESFECPYGDGNSAQKVLESIEYYMENLR